MKLTGIRCGSAAAVMGVGIIRAKMNANRAKSLKYDRRPPMTPEQFLANFTVTEASKNVILGVRAGVAKATGLAADALYPSDSFEDLLQLGFDGMDFIEVLVGIEKFMNVRLRHDLVAEEITRMAGGSMDFTLMDFAQRCAQRWGAFTGESC
jgi:acyl carrier protein